MEYYIEFKGSIESVSNVLREFDSLDLRISIVSNQDMPPTSWVLIALNSSYNTLKEVSDRFKDARILFYEKLKYDESFAKECEVSYYRLNRPNSYMVHHTDCNAKVLHAISNTEACSELYRNKYRNMKEAVSLLKSRLSVKNA